MMVPEGPSVLEAPLAQYLRLHLSVLRVLLVPLVLKVPLVLPDRLALRVLPVRMVLPVNLHSFRSALAVVSSLFAFRPRSPDSVQLWHLSQATGVCCKCALVAVFGSRSSGFAPVKVASSLLPSGAASARVALCQEC